MHTAIYELLKETARAGRLITYGEVAPLANLHLESQGDRNRLAQLLGEISQHEHSQGHPMLSAVVVVADTQIPGKGFFTFAKELGKYQGSTELQELEFYAKELRRVYDYWRSAT
jgi:hypothetical protein